MTSSKSSRARAQRGSVRFSQGAWRIAVRAGNYPNGKKRVLYATHRAPNTPAGEAEANEVMFELVLKARRLKDGGVHTDGTLGDVVQDYLKWGSKPNGGFHGDGWSPATQRFYRQLWENHIKPSPVSHLPAAKLKVAHIEDLLDDVPSGQMRKSVHTVLRSALGRAVRREELERNVAAAVSVPHVKPRITPPKPEAVAALLEHLEAEAKRTGNWFHYAFIRMAASTGARRASIAGLMWDDIDLDTGTVHFSRAVVRGIADQAKGQTVKGLKSRNEYKVQLDPTTVSVLRRHRVASAQRLLALPESGGGWVFPALRDASKPVPVDNLTTWWSQLRKRIPGLEGARLHDLRHFVATQLLAAGVPVTAVAARLGHENPSTTLDVYGSAIPAQDTEAAAHLAALMDGTG